MKHTSILTAVALSTTLLLGSCKSDSTSSNNSSGTNNTPANTMMVTVDGTTYTWPATATKTQQSGQTIISVAGADTSSTGNGRGGGFTLNNITGTGSYDVGTLHLSGTTVQTTVMVFTRKDATGNSQTFSSPTTPGTTSVGNVTIQQLDATTIKATFNGNLTLNGSGSGGTMTVTNGSVNATIH